MLGELLETRRMPDKKYKDPDETATFLTQVYKESELTQKDLERKFPNWSSDRNIAETANKLIEGHAKTRKNVAH